jgi:hypothetical protein
MTFPTPRPSGTSRPLLVCAFLALGAQSGCKKKVDCAQICERVGQCKAQVSQALVDRQPSKSRFMKHVRKHLPERMVPRLIKSCPERCEALSRSKKWRKKLQACSALTECKAFADCIAPVLEP